MPGDKFRACSLGLQIAEQKQLVSDMADGFAVMSAGFGPEHLMVRKAEAIMEAMRRTSF